MKILIDMQGAQGTNEKRGIGRYALSFTKSFISSRIDADISILLNGAFEESIDLLKSEIWGVSPDITFYVWSPLQKCAYLQDANDDSRKFSEDSRESFISSLNMDIVIVTSMFEGLVDNCVLSHNPAASNHKTITILYDLIPLIHKDIYLSNERVSRWYFEKLSFLTNSDFIFSISESSRNEAIGYLNIKEEKIFNISTACDDNFSPVEVNSFSKEQLFKKYGVKNNFILYTGGIDHRKNIERLIESYSIISRINRESSQLVVVCAIHEEDRKRFTNIVKGFGLNEGDVVFTGYVPEKDLINFYNLALFFIFPSWHEGFGLPVLEAMKCELPVIGSSLSSIPEVIGNHEYLFDPYDCAEMAAMISKMMNDHDFRDRGKKHSKDRAQLFSWKDTAEKAWAAIDLIGKNVTSNLEVNYLNKPRLAFVSPLPPGASGISDYSADLIPGLSKYYHIDVVVEQDRVDSFWVSNNCRVISVREFEKNNKAYDRVIYHFGNSDFHSHMFKLLDTIPGVVVLHDFFLSGIVAHLDIHGGMKNLWPKTLLENHGWPAVEGRYKANDTADIVFKYPCNISVLQSAIGVIVHSEYSKKLADNYYGNGYGNNWEVIPLLRKAPLNPDKKAARARIGIPEDAYLVCSFGHLGPTKLNDRLLDAWLDSALAESPNTYLVFVGQNHPGQYGSNLERKIKTGKFASRVFITGWNSADSYADWLAAADAGVQLRTLSRGETSAAVFDCLNYGIATIVNANGSMDDLDDSLVLKIKDDFELSELVDAINVLQSDREYVNNMASMAKSFVRENNSVESCSARYFSSVEKLYKKDSGSLNYFLEKISQSNSDDLPLDLIVRNISNNFRSVPRIKQLLVDVSELVQRDAKSGIQRVVRSIIFELLKNPPEGFNVRLVYTESGVDDYFYADKFTCKILGIPSDWASDTSIESYGGDIFLGLDLQPFLVQERRGFLQRMRARGVKVKFVIYDLIPILLPQVFPPEADINHSNWLKVVTEFDGAVCISKAVADDLFDWLETFGKNRALPYAIDYFHLGADVQNSLPDYDNVSLDSRFTIDKSYSNFLMVGTIEPRKGHEQVLDAFESLWLEGYKVRLIIVGKQGWMVENLISRIKNHPSLGDYLIFLEGVNDNILLDAYSYSDCLIFASEAEGFGLPLIEAAEHNISIIARDLPVFREVAGEHAFYFSNEKHPSAISAAVKCWMKDYKDGRAPSTIGMQWLTWAESSKQLVSTIVSDTPYKKWICSGAHAYWGSDFRLNSHVGMKSGRSISTSGVQGFLLFGPYVHLKAGTYKISVYGRISNLDSSEWFDLACDSGEITLAKMSLIKPEDTDLLLESTFVIDHDVKDFEFRCFVSDASVVSIERVIFRETVNDDDSIGGASHIDLNNNAQSVSENEIIVETKAINDKIDVSNNSRHKQQLGGTYNNASRNSKSKKSSRNRKR